MHFLKSYILTHKKLLFISMWLATINQLFSLVNPQVFRLIIDRYATKIDQFTQPEFLKGVWWLLLISVLAAWISRIAKTFQEYFVNLMSQKIGAAIYADSIAHTFSLPYRVFEDRRSWSLLDKLQKARQDIQKFMQSMINTVFLTSIGILIVTVYAFAVHRIIGIIFLVMLPILAVTTLYLSKRVQSAQQNIVRTSAELAGTTIENIKNVSLIKSIGLEQQEVKHLNAVNDQLIELEIEKLKLIKSITFYQGTLINFLRTVLEFMLLRLVFTQGISLGEYFTLLFYSFLLFNPLYELPTLAANRQEVKASNEILEEIHALPQEIRPENPVVLERITDIRFDNVSFGYTSTELAVQKISFSVNPGETIAFVGPSGAGKTTILKLLTWLYLPSEGGIFFNTTNTNTLDREAIKHRVGIVSQDTQLFSGTIRENLLFVAPQATEEQCILALQQAQLFDLIQETPAWLDSRIGEGWLKLSGGQKQRLAIARALLRNPDVLIFDEATSSLDSLVEAKITDTIKTISDTNKHLITLVVAHRLSTVMHATRIYVLENGSIVEAGTHTTLLAEKGLYYALRRQQTGSAQ